ncbi:hypothetical protein ACJRO7_033717 [Eucalyptus globulus]|uniref:Uncharacterized protein n=1 Tax=Eucalyptus globulus TaxID=34317 RepID=A0ABD3J100_EUCGL
MESENRAWERPATHRTGRRDSKGEGSRREGRVEREQKDEGRGAVQERGVPARMGVQKTGGGCSGRRGERAVTWGGRKCVEVLKSGEEPTRERDGEGGEDGGQS